MSSDFTIFCATKHNQKKAVIKTILVIASDMTYFAYSKYRIAGPSWHNFVEKLNSHHCVLTGAIIEICLRDQYEGSTFYCKSCNKLPS